MGHPSLMAVVAEAAVVMIAAAGIAGCESLPGKASNEPPPPASATDAVSARKADDAAFAAALASLVPLDGHFVGVAAGRVDRKSVV